MKYGFFGIGIIAAGLIGIVFLVMFQSITVNNETEYYVLKEAMEASMLESVDIACYRDANAEGCGEVIKISEQKFVENFTRRFTENITGDVQKYGLEFYDIIESPPKASVVIKGLSQNFGIMDDASFDITNSLSGILEYEPVELSHSAGWITLGNNNESLEVDIQTEVLESNHTPEGDCETCH